MTAVLSPEKEKSSGASLMCESGSLYRFGSPSCASLSIFGPPRIADTEHAGDFIERLACCVVACAAEDFKLGVAFHHHDLTVTAGRNQCQNGGFSSGYAR